MKRSFATVLLVAHLFNLGGYLLLNQYLVSRSNKFINQQISKGKYDTRTLIEIKIKQNLPQIHNWKAYASISGQIQFKGVSYNYVKLRVTRDTLYVKCIPNYETTKLLNENVICAKQINDVPVSKKAHESSGKKSGIDNKYNYPVITYSFLKAGQAIQKPGTFIYINISHPFFAVSGQPPETAVV